MPAVHARHATRHTRARARTHTHTAPRWTQFFFFMGAPWGSKRAAARVKTDALQGVALLQGCSRRNRTLLQACSVRAPVSLRGPFRGKSFELPRRKARGDGR